MTPDILIAFSAAAVAIIFDWFPPAQKWFDAFGAGEKRGLMAGAMLLIVIGAFILSCARVYTVLTCDQTGATQAVQILIMAIIINQGVHAALKPTK